MENKKNQRSSKLLNLLQKKNVKGQAISLLDKMERVILKISNKKFVIHP